MTKWFYSDADVNHVEIKCLMGFVYTGDAFRNRLRKFPSLVNCCTIDWFQPWPEDALEAVATRFLEDVELTEETRLGCINMCKNFHTSTQKLSERFLQVRDYQEI